MWIEREIRNLTNVFDYWARKFFNEFKRPKCPGLISIRVTSEGENGMSLNFTVLLPPAGAADVVKRELTVAIGTGDPVPKELTTETEVGGFSGNDNDAVAVSLVDVDDAGNRSEARNQTFTLTDTIAPPMPDSIGLRVDSET